MKLVEADTRGPEDEIEIEEDGHPSPPRPERRRVSVSLIFTLLVLVATVVTIYVVFPARHNALMETALDAHQQTDWKPDLDHPGPAELHAWGLALLGVPVPWPKAGADLQIVGASATKLLNRPAAIVRYRIGDQRVTVLVQRPREPIPRTLRRHENGLLCVTWRRGKLSFTAVGPEDADHWRTILHAP